MRRKDRQITNIDEIIEIVDRCMIARLGMSDENKPYIVPLNYGYSFVEDRLELYFHCAAQGKKIDILNKNPNVFFEMDIAHNVTGEDEACSYGINYESVTGSGVAQFIDDFAEKTFALQRLMSCVTKKDGFEFNQKAVENVTVFKVTSSDFTAKRRMVE